MSNSKDEKYRTGTFLNIQFYRILITESTVIYSSLIPATAMV